MTAKMPSPLWMSEANRWMGTQEVPGPQHNSKILGWLAQLKAWWRDDETPWCGVLVAYCLQASGLPIPRGVRTASMM